MRSIFWFVVLIATAAAPPALARPADVAITFDDLPGLSLTQDQGEIDFTNAKLLAGLRKHHLRAIGFVNEGKIDELNRVHQIENLRRWLSAGMQLGNHTFSHESPNTLGSRAYIADIQRGERVTGRLVRLRHERLHWFRHPYLETGNPRGVRRQIDMWLARHGYSVAPVTMNPDDWEFAAVYDDAMAHHNRARSLHVRQLYLAHLAASIAWDRSAARTLFGREISYVLLLHVTRLNADCIDEIARLLRDDRLRAVPLSRAMMDPIYRVPDRYYGKDGIDWLERWSLRSRVELPWGDYPKVPASIQRAYDSVETDRTS